MGTSTKKAAAKSIKNVLETGDEPIKTRIKSSFDPSKFSTDFGRSFGGFSGGGGGGKFEPSPTASKAIQRVVVVIQEQEGDPLEEQEAHELAQQCIDIINEELEDDTINDSILSTALTMGMVASLMSEDEKESAFLNHFCKQLVKSALDAEYREVLLGLKDSEEALNALDDVFNEIIRSSEYEETLKRAREENVDAQALLSDLFNAMKSHMSEG